MELLFTSLNEENRSNMAEGPVYNKERIYSLPQLSVYSGHASALPRACILSLISLQNEKWEFCLYSMNIVSENLEQESDFTRIQTYKLRLIVESLIDFHVFNSTYSSHRDQKISFT